MVNDGLKNTLQYLLTQYGGSKYKNYTLEQVKNQVTKALDDIKIKSPAERAIIIKFKNHILKAKSVEDILSEITEKMFSLESSI